MSEGDRRAPGATRIPFEAMVEVGGATGPAFEAQAVDVSREGMHLRTAYLPEVGQPLTCRFDAGPRETVLASGEVVWSEEAARGGEFGIRFSNLDAESARVLGRLTDVPASPHGAGNGMKVRLHIDGLGSPMRARVKDTSQSELTVGSELGFLQVGKDLELENAETGQKRPARIDRVEVRVDPESHVPELVVTLRYADAPDSVHTGVASVAPVAYAAPIAHAAPVAHAARAGAAPESAEPESPAPARVEHAHSDTADTAPIDAGSHASVDVDLEEEEEDPGSMQNAAGRVKGALSRGAAKVAPAINAFASRAKTTFALLAARRWRAQGEAKDDVAIPMRRVTAPPPGGGLHAEGRKVVRDFSALRDGLAEKTPKFVLDKKKMIIGGTVGALLILGAVAMRKPSAPPVAETPVSEAPVASGAPPAAPEAAPNPVGAAPVLAAPMVPTTPVAVADLPRGNSGASDSPRAPSEERRTPKRIAVAPFSHGTVTHGNVLRLKMDGSIEKIQGAAQTTGFTVVVPSRRSLEAAAPLAARDGRIASIKVVNDPGGAELSVTFKDGVPNYLVRAKGEVLEIVLAPVGRINDRQAVADAAHDGHDGPAHVRPGAPTAKRKHTTPRKH